jgi:hypothetical protein
MSDNKNRENIQDICDAISVEITKNMVESAMLNTATIQGTSMFDRFNTQFTMQALDIQKAELAVNLMRKAVADYCMQNLVEGETLGRVMSILDYVADNARNIKDVTFMPRRKGTMW